MVKWQPRYSPWRLCGWNCSHLGLAWAGPLGPSHTQQAPHAGYRCAVWLLKTLLGLWTGGNIWCLHVAWTFRACQLGSKKTFQVGKSQLTAIYQASVYLYTCKKSHQSKHVTCPSSESLRVAPQQSEYQKTWFFRGHWFTNKFLIVIDADLSCSSLLAKIFMTDRESKDWIQVFSLLHVAKS